MSLVRPQVLLRDLSTLMATFGRHSLSVHHKAVGSKSFTCLYIAPAVPVLASAVGICQIYIFAHTYSVIRS